VHAAGQPPRAAAAQGSLIAERLDRQFVQCQSEREVGFLCPMWCEVRIRVWLGQLIKTPKDSVTVGKRDRQFK
jgi:hypothetical protein